MHKHSNAKGQWSEWVIFLAAYQCVLLELISQEQSDVESSRLCVGCEICSTILWSKGTWTRYVVMVIRSPIKLRPNLIIDGELEKSS